MFSEAVGTENPPLPQPLPKWEGLGEGIAEGASPEHGFTEYLPEEDDLF